MRKTLPLLAILGAGLALRLLLAYVVFSDQGFASDIQLFASWARSLGAGGPGAFYATSPSANYPPAYLYVLWALGSISGGQPSAGLLKLPAIVADVGVALLLYRLAERWRGPRAGLLAAGLYLFIPVTCGHGRARGRLAARHQWGRGTPQLPCPLNGGVDLGRRGHPLGERAERSDRGPSLLPAPFRRDSGAASPTSESAPT